ncbi:MAG: hypothetical protein FWD17_14055 [Polyangiaceae bacterium]|nr:hypothetical protein [Polyangiaceae bacterium]
MTTIQWIDVEVLLPDGTVVDVKRHRMAGAILYGLTGRSIDVVRDRLEIGAILRGFELTRSSEGSHLARRGQRIDLILAGSSHAVIRVEDPESLPDARVDARGIVIGPLAIAVHAERIVPGKERHDPRACSWNGDWYLDGVGPGADLCASIHRQLLDLSPRSSGLWRSGGLGAGRWSVEADLLTMRVQVYLREQGRGLRVDVFMVHHAAAASGCAPLAPLAAAAK